MNDITILQKKLSSIDGRGYKSYKSIEGTYTTGHYIVHIDHVQGDPFAAPSRVRAVLDQAEAMFPADTYTPGIRNTALRDYLTRGFHTAILSVSSGIRGTGKGGLISIDIPGQEILERSSAIVTEQKVEIRFFMGLPAFGRKVAGAVAIAMFFKELPQIIEKALYFKNLDQAKLYTHIQTAEDAEFMRHSLAKHGLVAFVADNSVLPRKSGIDQHPLTRGTIVPFTAPPEMSVTLDAPNSKKITGMGVPEGITLIVGGGYHGKSTLLQAIERGVYNHIPGDGREFVVTRKDAVKIRAEDGRRIEKVSISPFINNLPFNQDTDAFCSEDASGSTSQAANIIEAVETGTSLLLIDEDTSATNFMIRDHRMQELVNKEHEPITPFIDKVKQMHTDLGISTILVIGGSGDYFDVADRTICMKEYTPQDVSNQALRIADKYKKERTSEGGSTFGTIYNRVPLADSFNARKGKNKVKVASRGLSTILFGYHTISLHAIEQLVHESQTGTIALAIQYALQYMDGKRTLHEILGLIENDINTKGLDILSPWITGDLARFRPIELACAINRLRTLQVVPVKDAAKDTVEKEKR